MLSCKKIDLLRDFAAAAYQSLETGDTFSHDGIFDPALGTVALKIGENFDERTKVLAPTVSTCMYITRWGWGGFIRQINTCRQVLYR